MTNPFFDEMSEQSLVKATIVAKYFRRWANIMIATGKNNERLYGKPQEPIVYIDLFAGPGRYKQGSKSTPLLILEEAINDPDISDRLITIFNDKDETNVKSLEEEINKLPGIQCLKHEPTIMHHEVGTEIVQLLAQMHFGPTLFFVDPFGYKELSLELINSVLQPWGCDCIFFFNYNRVNMGLNNEIVRKDMNALFGEKEADSLRRRSESLSPDERELFIVETLAQSLKGTRGNYVLPFRFRNQNDTRTSHHLIFVSKHFKGYETMKEVMADESSSLAQGVASFEYNPASERQPLLFQLARPLEDLGNMLLQGFAGRTLTMHQIYEKHSVGKAFIKKNYKQVLTELETAGKITASKHRKGTFGDEVKVTFPAQS